MLFLALFFSVLAQASGSFVVNATELRVREKPGGQSLCLIPQGTKLEANGPSDGTWIPVKMPSINGCPTKGFVGVKYLAPVKAAPSPSTALPEKKIPTLLLDPQKVTVIQTQAYDPTKESGRGFSEFTSSFGLATFGNIYKATALDLEKDILEKLSMPQLARYFPNQKENRSIAKKIGGHIEKVILKGGLSNQNVNEAILYAATKLVDQIIQRALEVEGVKDAERRKLWAKRLLNSFHRCMSKTISYGEGSSCLDALQIDLVNNLGLAISYELAAQETGPENAQAAPEQYRKCLKPQLANADQRVQPCVLEVMRSSVEKFGVKEVEKIAQETLSPADVKIVSASAKKTVNACLKTAKDRAGFLKCADSLTVSAGGELTYYSVLANPQVKELFPKEVERKNLAGMAKSSFHDCLQKENKRDAQGKIQTEACVNFVTMETTKTVANRLFAANLEKLGGLTEQEKNNVLKKVTGELNKCWDSLATAEKNNRCMKDSVQSLVLQVAELKLGRELPPALQKSNPKLSRELLSSVEKCLEQELPQDILTATDSAQKVELCAGKLLKSSALRVAKHEIDGVLEGKTSNEDAKQNLTSSLIETNFDRCLGESPGEAKLTECSVQLKTSAGAEIGKLLFQEEFDKYVNSKGGLQNLGLSPEVRDQYLEKLYLAHTECLKKNTNPKQFETADKAVDTCFKSSITNMASYLADVTFQARLKENLTDPKIIQELAPLFRAEFQQCLAEKNNETINNFIPQVSVCGDRLTKQYTVKVADRELRLAIASALPGQKKREEEIFSAVFPRFASCVEKTTGDDPGDRDRCARSLKTQATLVLAAETSRNEALRLLNVTKLPSQFSDLERNLRECLERDYGSEFCARRHAQSVAAEIARIKFRSSMADALGSEYAKHENELKKLEQEFAKCLVDIPGQKPDAAFLAALKKCGEDLEKNGIAFAQNYLKTSLRKIASTPDQQRIGDQVAEVLPCLDPLFPGGPAEDPAFRAIDPEGVFSKLTGAISEYISLDVKKSEKDIDRILKEVFADLYSTGTEESRKKLFDVLVYGGMLDQLIHAMVRAEIKKSLAALPPQDQLPQELQQVLLDKETIVAALSPEVMARYRPHLAQRLLKPILLEGKSLKEPALKSALAEMEKGLAEALLESHDFGQKLTKGMIQKSIDDKTAGTLSRWFFKNLAGYTYNWDSIRGSQDAIQAEKYIKGQIIRPMIMDSEVSPEEMRKRREEASRLVEAALKNQ
jgi:hypothetical protein